MRILKINPLKPEKGVIRKAVEVLEIGGLVVYPTETLYGLGANPFDEQALQRVFEIKERDMYKPISLAFRDLKQMEKFVMITSSVRRLVEKFLPGPLTLILPAKMQVDDIIGGDKIGVRIPDNGVAQELLKEVRFPLTATSANLSGGKDPVTAEEAIEQIGDKVDLILDAGRCKYGKPSTVVDLTSDKIEIVREGVISKKRILESLS